MNGRLGNGLVSPNFHPYSILKVFSGYILLSIPFAPSRPRCTPRPSSQVDVVALVVAVRCAISPLTGRPSNLRLLLWDGSVKGTPEGAPVRTPEGAGAQTGWGDEAGLTAEEAAAAAKAMATALAVADAAAQEPPASDPRTTLQVSKDANAQRSRGT